MAREPAGRHGAVTVERAEGRLEGGRQVDVRLRAEAPGEPPDVGPQTGRERRDVDGRARCGHDIDGSSAN